MSAPVLRPLSEDDVPQLLTLRRLSFNRAEDPGAAGVQRTMRARLPHVRGAFVAGRLVAAATWYPFEAWVGGVRVPTGALAGVVSAPEERRRGHVRRLLHAGFEELRERGVGWSLEHPFDPRFYARVGYESVPNGALIELPIDRMPPPGEVDAELLSAADLARLQRMHEAFAQRWTFALARTWRPRPGAPSPMWAGLLSAEDEEPPPFSYAVEDGYLIASLDGRDAETVLDVHDLVWRDGEGRRRLWSLIAAFRGQAERVRVHLPPGDPLLADWSAWHATHGRLLQARIVDLQAALEPLRPAPGAPRGAVTVRVRDGTCRWNDGVWRIEAGDGGSAVRPADAEPQASLDARALVSLLTGCAPEVLVADGRAEGDPAALRVLAGLTAAHPPYLTRADAF